jgi:DNA-binding NarL/FixJ family response regulator
MTAPLKIIIADDHPIFRSGLREIVERDARFEVVAEAGDGRAALSLIEELRPDIVILDVNMPEMGGFAVAREMRDRQLPCEIIFLTMHDEEAMFIRALDLGAKGYVLKDGAAADIVACLDAVAGGRNYTSAAVTGYLFKRAGSPAKTDALAGLTPTERAILNLISQYKSSKEIADELSVSSRTVENHRYNICGKLNLRGSNALVRFAMENRDLI